MGRLVVYHYMLIRYGKYCGDVMCCVIIHVVLTFWILCCGLFVLSLSIINIQLIPFIVAICWYVVLVWMGVLLLLEVWVYNFDLFSFLWYMGWNNISGWEYFIVLWSWGSGERWGQSLDVKEEKLFDSFELEEADDHEWFMLYCTLFWGIVVDGHCLRL